MDIKKWILRDVLRGTEREFSCEAAVVRYVLFCMMHGARVYGWGPTGATISAGTGGGGREGLDMEELKVIVPVF